MKSLSYDELLTKLKACVFYQRDGHVIRGRNGEQHEWIVDIRGLLLDGPALSRITEMFWSRLSPPFQVGGVEMTAIPLVTSIVLSGHRTDRPVNGFVIRKEPKTSGLMRRIEGKLTEAPIVIVDDIFNSGESAEVARAALGERKIRVLFAVIDFESEKGRNWLAEHSIRLVALFTKKEIMN